MSTQLSFIFEMKFNNSYSLTRHFLILHFEIHKLMPKGKKKKIHSEEDKQVPDIEDQKLSS